MPPLSLDDVLDRFEASWRESLHAHASPPALLSYLQGVSDCDAAAQCELACIDLERRWKTFYRAGHLDRRELVAGLPRCPIVEDYLLLLPALRAETLPLVQFEFEVRQRYADRPTVAEVSARFPQFELLPDQLRSFAVNCTRGELRLILHGQTLFTCPLPGRLRVGRGRSVGNAFPGLTTENDRHRLVIAPHEFNAISRDHLEIDLVAYERVQITNCSKYDRVRIQQTATSLTLASGEHHVTPLPVTITVVDRQLQLALPAS